MASGDAFGFNDGSDVGRQHDRGLGVFDQGRWQRAAPLLVMVPARLRLANLANPIVVIGGFTVAQASGAANSANLLTDALLISGLAALAACDACVLSCPVMRRQNVTDELLRYHGAPRIMCT